MIIVNRSVTTAKINYNFLATENNFPEKLVSEKCLSTLINQKMFMIWLEDKIELLKLFQERLLLEEELRKCI